MYNYIISYLFFLRSTHSPCVLACWLPGLHGEYVLTYSFLWRTRRNMNRNSVFRLVYCLPVYVYDMNTYIFKVAVNSQNRPNRNRIRVFCSSLRVFPTWAPRLSASNTTTVGGGRLSQLTT